MCRWIAYSGQPLYIDELVLKPERSLIEQSRDARIGVNTTQIHNVTIVKFRSNGNVGCQHELLDDLVTFIVVNFVCTGDFPFGIELELHLRQVKIQRTGFKATTTQQHRQFIHVRQ